MKTLDMLPVRVAGIARADGTPYEDDWRSKYVGALGTLFIRESERKFPGKKCAKLDFVADRVDGALEYRLGIWLRTSCGDLARDEGSIVLSTANSVYRFERLVGDELDEYETLVEGDDWEIARLASFRRELFPDEAPPEPLFKHGDRVEFEFARDGEEEKTVVGTVERIDDRSADRHVFKDVDWSYDIRADCGHVYKHFPENILRPAKGAL